MFAKVIVDIASSNVDKIFDYSFSSYPNIKAGTRVLVPFGNRAIEGIIIGFADKTNFDESKIKDIIRPLEEFPVINSDQFAIMNFLKRTFHIGNADAYVQDLSNMFAHMLYSLYIILISLPS